MRVLYFSDNVSDHNRRFLEKLSEAGIEIWFLDPTSEVAPESWLPRNVYWIQSRQRLRRDTAPDEFAEFLPEFQDCLTTIRPDLVHSGPAHTCGYVTALSEFHPWLLTSWGSDVLSFLERGADWDGAIRAALSSADGLFFDCEAVRAKAKQLADIPDGRIVQFPWGVRKGSFAPEGPRPAEFVHESGTCVLISTRSWEPLYKIDVLLAAFRRAYTVNPSLRLLLLGNGSEAPRIRKFIGDHKLTGAIQLPGNVNSAEMPKWFRAADVYVSCAPSDGTSVSLLEAMASGLPVVVTDIPSNREWVVEGQNGWLAQDGSAEEFADPFLRAAKLSVEERMLFSRRNRSIVEERADWDRNFPKLLQMYERLVATPVKS